jgi:hypothetical protein
MANYEATRYDFDGANLTGIEGIPTGTITPWSQATAPTGFFRMRWSSGIEINVRSTVCGY